MYRYILLFLALIILLGHQQLVGVGRMLNNYFSDDSVTKAASNNSNTSNKQKPFYKRFFSFRNGDKGEKNKVNNNENLFAWLSDATVERNSWNYYKKTFISQEGRVIDHQRASVTTSEGQAYAMRRALMIGDKSTFDKTYNWAKYNLQHKNDKLFAWLWGQKNLDKQTEIEYGIIDNNSATDGDAEIAVCLILASKVWNQESYKKDALDLIKDIWNKETVKIRGERILVSGVSQKKAENIEVNPSYFMTHAFRIFAEFDRGRDWLKLVDSSYRLTNWCIDNIDSGLPPDVFYINRNTGRITFDENKSDFSYDAVRVFYRFYIDYTITKEPRAKKLLSKSKLFIDRWHHDKKFYTSYEQNGELKNHDEFIGSIAVILPAIKMYDKKTADEIYTTRIKAQYHSKGYWEDPMNYYEQNLVWLGNWLYLNEENIKSFKY